MCVSVISSASATSQQTTAHLNFVSQVLAAEKMFALLVSKARSLLNHKQDFQELGGWSF